MDVKLDEIPKKSNEELMELLKELKADMKELKKERYLPGAMVTDGARNKLSESQKLRSFLVRTVKEDRAALRKEYRKREPSILCLNKRKDPCCTAASPPGVVMLPASSEDGEGKEAYKLLHGKV